MRGGVVRPDEQSRPDRQREPSVGVGGAPELPGDEAAAPNSHQDLVGNEPAHLARRQPGAVQLRPAQHSTLTGREIAEQTREHRHPTAPPAELTAARRDVALGTRGRLDPRPARRWCSHDVDRPGLGALPVTPAREPGDDGTSPSNACGQCCRHGCSPLPPLEV